MYLIELDWKPPGGNQIKKMKHWAYKKLRQEWVNRFQSYFHENKAPFPGPRKVYVILDRPIRKMRLDYDNLVWTFKPGLDALQITGVLRDDSPDAMEAYYIQTSRPGGLRIWLTTKVEEFNEKKRVLENI